MQTPTELLELAIQYSPWLILAGIAVYLVARMGVGGYKFVTGKEWLPAGWYNRAQITRRTGLYVIGGGIVFWLLGLTYNQGNTPSTDFVTLPETTTQSQSPAETSSEQQTITTTIESDLSPRELEAMVHDEINTVRVNNDLSRLLFDDDLAEIARYHSQDMAEQNYFAHESPTGETVEDRYQQFNYNCRVSTGGNRYTTGGENILYTYYQTPIRTGTGEAYYETPSELVAGVVNQWMNSEGHRENILRSYWNNEGIGVYIDEEESQSRIYVTQNFC